MPEFQDLEVGDTILMAPGMGFEVCMLDPPHHVVGLLAAGPTSWFIGLFPTGDSVRLLSRWRPTVERSAGGLATLAIIEPGTFVMERKMLRTIKQRVEASHTERVAT